MLLAIDVGNTNMVFGLYDGDKLRGSFRISTNSERTSDELGMLIAQYYHSLQAAMRISALKTAMPTRARSARTDWSTRFLRFASTASRSSS